MSLLSFYHGFSLPSYEKNFPESAILRPFKHFNIPPMLTSGSKIAPSPPTTNGTVSMSSSNNDRGEGIGASYYLS